MAWQKDELSTDNPSCGLLNSPCRETGASDASRKPVMGSLFKENMTKFIFPFYKKERHHFLVEKWWFRSIIVIYVIAFVTTPFALWLWHVNQASGWCYDSLSLFLLDDTYSERLEECSKLARDAWTTGIQLAIIDWLTIHYLIQIIFFKIIVNYIVLGGKK